MQEYFESNNIALNIPGLDKKKINSIKSKNLEMFLIKERKDKYPEELINDYKLNNNNNSINFSINKDTENAILIKNKKYITNITSRINPNNKVSVLNKRKIKENEDNIFTSINHENGLKKNLQKITPKKIAFVGMTDKRAKLIFNDNKNFFLFNNNVNNMNNMLNNKDNKHNLKPLNEIKEIHNEKKRNHISKFNLANNKNFSSFEIRPKNKNIIQNDYTTNNNSLPDYQNLLIDNKFKLNDNKEHRNQTSNLSLHKEKENNTSNVKKNENLISIKNKKKSQKDTIESNSSLNNNSTGIKEKIKVLSQKEKAYFILSQSKLLQLKERIIFSRSTENIRSLISIKEMINSNELFKKEKLKELKIKLLDYSRKIETAFSPSKTADISLNIIKKDDEDVFKCFLDSYNNIDENEKKYYHTYICLLYILLGENINGINWENIDSNSLFDKLNEKGYEHLKDYLYIKFIKQNSKILREQNRMDIFCDMYNTLPDLIKYSGNIGSNKFVCFSYFLIKEIYEYWNNLKKCIELKNKTQSNIEYLKTKISNID